MKIILFGLLMTLMSCKLRFDYHATYHGKTIKVKSCSMYEGYMTVRLYDGSKLSVKTDDMSCMTKRRN